MNMSVSLGASVSMNRNLSMSMSEGECEYKWIFVRIYYNRMKECRFKFMNTSVDINLSSSTNRYAKIIVFLSLLISLSGVKI